MARKRMLDPEFFMDTEIISNLDMTGRMLYIGMWTTADDGGLLENDPLSFKIRIFPADNITPDQISQYINTLINIKKLVPYEYDGKSYLWIKNFLKHQKLDKPSRSSIPLPPWLKFIEGEKRHECQYEVLYDPLKESNIDVSGTCRGRVEDMPSLEVEVEVEKEIEKNNVDDFKKSSCTQKNDEDENDVNREYYNAALELRKEILKYNPKCKVPDASPKGITKWADVMRLIFERDKRSSSDFHELVNFIFNQDDFWNAQIQSPTSLRKHWDKIYAKMIKNARAPSKANKNNKFNNFTGRKYDYEELERQVREKMLSRKSGN